MERIRFFLISPPGCIISTGTWITALISRISKQPCRWHDQEFDPEIKIQILQRAAALYQGPFAPTLDGIWSEPVRYGLYLDYERAMLFIAGYLLSQDKTDPSLAVIEQLLAADPGQEAAWRLAMRCYAARADRSGIKEPINAAARPWQKTFHMKPSEETSSLYQKLIN